MSEVGISWILLNSTSSATMNESSTVINANFPRCQVRRTSAFLGFTVLPATSILLNGFVLFAIIMHRRKLRHNHVYYHVANTLITNVIFSLLALYQIFSLYFAFNGEAHEELDRQGVVRDEMRIWWAFCRALLTGIFLVMCGNIGVLVATIRDATHGPLLSGSRTVEMSLRKNGNKEEGEGRLAKLLSGFDLKKRQRRSWILISIVWLLPLAYVISAPAGLSCAHLCKCVSGCYKADLLNSPESRECSRVWPPMRVDWLVVSAALWVISVLVVTGILWRTLRQTKRHFNYCSKRLSPLIPPRYLTSTSWPPSNVTIPAETNADGAHHPSLARSRRVLARALGRLRYLIGITILFVFCTSPAMVLMIIDYVSISNPSMILGNGCLSVPFLYCWACPVLLMKCLPGIRSALVAILCKC